MANVRRNHLLNSLQIKRISQRCISKNFSGLSEQNIDLVKHVSFPKREIVYRSKCECTPEKTTVTKVGRLSLLEHVLWVGKTPLILIQRGGAWLCTNILTTFLKSES